MKSKRGKVGVAILTHWHTGSSLLARQLVECGMKVGNEKTFWDQSCEAQCEHSLLNQIGDQLWLGNITIGEAKKQTYEILNSYVEQAEECDWKVFGIKATHCLYPQCWPMFKVAFQECWPELAVISIERDLEGIVKSTRDPAWPRERIADSWAQVQPAMQDIQRMRNGYIPHFPHDWDDNESFRIAKITRELKLTWKDKAQRTYQQERV